MGSKKGDATREHVLETALALFRKRGFQRTTMRDIAQAAELSLGAAYHYFPSKEALVGAYYVWMQDEHERLAREASLDEQRLAAAAPASDLRTRIDVLFRTKLELLRRDRKLLGALFGNLGDPADPLSVFGKEHAALRERSIAQFVAVFGDEVPPELRPMLGQILWLAHLGVFLFFVHDASPRQVRTQKLTDAVVDLVASGAPMLGHPLAAPVRSKLVELMTQLDLSH